MARRYARRFTWLLFVASSLLLAVAPGFALTNYTDPAGYPAAWPSVLTTQAYTNNGNAQYDLTGSSDQSNGGTTPQQAVDFSSGPSNNQPSIYYYGNGSILFFRVRLITSPLATTGSGQPFTSATWNILLDIDGDGFKEFAIMVDGTGGNTGGGASQVSPDDIVVVYDNAADQRWTFPQAGIWRQDTAGPNDGADGASGNSSSWDSDPSASVWDFGRTRVIQITPGDKNSEYFLDIQVPVSALDATAIGGPVLTANTLFTIAATTSNSNTDPTQKDLLYAGSLTSSATSPLPSGDLTNGNGTIIQAPVITQVTQVTACPNATLKATVIDATTTSGGQTVDTINNVKFEYFLDANANGQADDAGQQWTLIGAASRVSGVLGQWQFVWDLSQRSNNTYLVRAIATDTQGNTTYSTNQPILSPSSVTATVVNTCSAVPSFAPSSKTTVNLPSPVNPGAVITYQVVVSNGGGATATNVVVRDTLSTHLTYVANSANPAPTSIDSVNVGGVWRKILVWTFSSMAAGSTQTITFQAQVKSPIPNQTVVTNTAWISSTQTAALAVSVQFTVTSLPDIVLVKAVDRAQAVPGETLIYTITYTNQGTDTATLLVVTSSSPSSTAYVSNSVVVNSVPKTDAADGDNVTVSGGSITVNIGTVLPSGSGQIQFRVTIQ